MITLTKNLMFVFRINRFIQVALRFIGEPRGLPLQNAFYSYIVHFNQLIRKTHMPDKIATKVTEELAGASIPDLVLGLGMAVAQANEALHKSGSSVIYTIPEAEIELTVALSVSSQTQVGGNIGGSISAFAINASYSNVYGYSAEASSKIRIKLQATPRQAETPVAPTAPPAVGG